MGIVAVVLIGACGVIWAGRQQRRQRHLLAQGRQVEALRLSLEGNRVQLRRCHEDILVLRHALAARHLLDDTDLNRQRLRLVEEPRRQAQERTAIERDLGIAASRLVADSGDCTFH